MADKMAEKKMAAPTRTMEDELNVAVCSTPSTPQHSMASSEGPSTHSSVDTTTDHSPEGDWKEVVSRKTKKKLSLSPPKPVSPVKKKKEDPSMSQGRKTPLPPPKKPRVRSPLKEQGREKLVSGEGRQYSLHEKYDLDEVVTGQQPNKTKYIIIRAYRQLREGEKFNVDLPAYFIRFLGTSEWYLAKGPTSKYYHETNYNDIEERFKRAEPADNAIRWYDDLDHSCQAAMLDVDDGPSRRISRSRKRNSTSGNSSTCQNTSKRRCSGPGDEVSGLQTSCGRERNQKHPAPVKVSPEKPSDWFCNSFDSRAGRNRHRKNDRSIETIVAEDKPRPLEQRENVPSQPPQTTRVQSAELHQLDTSDLVMAEIDVSQPNLSSESKLSSSHTKDVLQGSSRIHDTYNTNAEASFISQTTQTDGDKITSKKFSCINDSLALIQVRRVNSGNPVPSQSQYFQSQAQSTFPEPSQTQLTVPMPTKFANYKPSQKADEKDAVTEKEISKCQGRICTPFNFSFVGCDTQCNCDTSSNSNIENSQSNGCENQDGFCNQNDKGKQTQKPAERRGCSSASDKLCKDNQIISSHHLSPGDEVDHSQFTIAGKYKGTKFKSNEQCKNSQLVSKDILSQAELISGTQYNLNTGTQFQTSQIPATSVFNQTGLIVDSQDNGNVSDCDIFEDSFNNSAVISQIEELDKRTILHTQTSGKKRAYKRTLEMERDPDISSHTQSLEVSCRQNNSEGQRKQKLNKCSLDSDIASIEFEMQKRRDNKYLSSAEVKSKSEVERTYEANSLNEKPKSITEQISVQKNICSSADLSSIIKVELKTELNRCQNPSELDITNGHTRPSLIHDSAVNIGDRKTNDNAIDTLQSTRIAEPVTPVVAGSLQDRLKKRLKENAGQKTPQGPGTLIQHLREQILERVQLEAAMAQSRNQPTDDIGPFYGLPSKVKQLFDTHRGIKTLYEWQDECLKLPAVVERKNLIYSLPTSGGKTLVAEILILQEILCRRKDALLILPFVSIVQEKVRNLSHFAVDLDFLVEEYAGSKGRFPPIKRRKNNSLFIATIEKAHSIVNSLIENDRMDSLGLVIVDELHMIGEGGSRGATLESTLMKILHSNENIQIIGMSATLNNIEDLQRFLNAEIYTNDFRPVQLTETIKLSDSIYSVNTKAKCPEDQFLHDRIVYFQYKPEMEKMDPDHVFGLVLEVIPDNSCLVFCPTKKNCENVAMMLCKMMVKYKRELSDVKKKERKDLLKELYNDAAGKICPVLQYTIHFGVAYHHSGLTMDERKLIEEAYIDGTLCLLACTSTLAAGVNLPAKRVILRCPYVGQYFISRSQYKQMVGRAGRAGIDTSGESILICKTTDREKICELLAGPFESCHSSLVYDGGKGVRNLILSTVGLQVTSSTVDVFKFMTRSLAKLQENYLNVDLIEMCKDSLQKLIDLGLVLQTKLQTDDCVKHCLEVTQLGKATFKGPIDPDNADMLYKDLKKAEEPLVLSTHLHLLYLVTPYDMVQGVSPSWFIYFNQISSLSPAELKVPALIGVPESYIARRASQQKSKLKVDEFVVNRFYLTLMLYDLWKQKTIWEVAEKFQQPRGFIQNLLSSAASFASCVAHFCQEMEEFWAYQDLLGNFVKRLSYCVTAELIPLMEIPGVKLGRAKLMYNAGFRTLSAIANADSEVLVKSVEHLPRKVAKQIVASAKLLLNEKAEAMMEEVEQLVSVPEGIATSSTAMTTTVATLSLVTPDLSQNSEASQEINNSV